MFCVQDSDHLDLLPSDTLSFYPSPSCPSPPVRDDAKPHQPSDMASCMPQATQLRTQVQVQLHYIKRIHHKGLGSVNKGP